VDIAATLRHVKPVVGITTSIDEVTEGAWRFDAAYSPLSYVEAVRGAGGVPVLLVADPDTDLLLDRIDALIATGGSGDVDPALYGEAPHPETHADFAGRDAFEGALIRGAAERGLPVLGICRGMQLIAALHGGRLHQHLDDVGADPHHRALPAGYARHAVELEPGSLAARAAGATRVDVASHHHQGVADPGPTLKVTGRAPADGAIEAVEDPERPFLLGVLWHPEEDGHDGRVVGALVTAAAGG